MVSDQEQSVFKFEELLATCPSKTQLTCGSPSSDSPALKCALHLCFVLWAA